MSQPTWFAKLESPAAWGPGELQFFAYDLVSILDIPIPSIFPSRLPDSCHHAYRTYLIRDCN